MLKYLFSVFYQSVISLFHPPLFIHLFNDDVRTMRQLLAHCSSSLAENVQIFLGFHNIIIQLFPAKYHKPSVHSLLLLWKQP